MSCSCFLNAIPVDLKSVCKILSFPKGPLDAIIAAYGNGRVF
jgi:hypothetical protein